MKSMIFTTTVGLMLIALAAAAAAVDFEKAKQQLLDGEESFVNHFRENVPSYSDKLLENLKGKIAEFDNYIDEEVQQRAKHWKQDGFSKNQVNELTNLFRTGRDRIKTKVLAIMNETKAARAAQN